MKTIELGRGQVALVDDVDYEKLSQNKWYVVRDGNTFYARRCTLINKKVITENMHRRILGLRRFDGQQIDHIDGDGLNNQRNNLRICSHAENMRNRRIQRNNTSGHKGVYWNKKDKKWWAHIMVDSRKIHLGSFDLKTNAALAYNQAATEYFGEYARLNELGVGV